MPQFEAAPKIPHVLADSACVVREGLRQAERVARNTPPGAIMRLALESV
jgi:hypothetical protein